MHACSSVFEFFLSGLLLSHLLPPLLTIDTLIAWFGREKSSYSFLGATNIVTDRSSSLAACAQTSAMMRSMELSG
jgi:hypothetical protein